MKSFAISIAAAVACYTLSTATAFAKPDEATAAEVAGCRYIHTVHASSGYGKHLDWVSLAKSSAEKKAGEVGATHIVWTHLRSTGSFNGDAEARAYACGR